jgi:hypothetical protein
MGTINIDADDGVEASRSAKGGIGCMKRMLD